MDRQSDPYHSRPLDIHRYCEYPEGRKVVDSLWTLFTEHFPEHILPRRGRKTSGQLKDQFKALILDLYVCWLEDPDQYLGIHLGKNAYKSDSRYNSLFISFKITEIAHQLRQLGWVDWFNFSYSGPNSRSNRTTRIRASEALIPKFKESGLSLDEFSFLPERECIWLTTRDPDDHEDVVRVSGKALLKYSDTEQTIRMRDEVIAYNTLLSKTHIDIASLEKPVVIRQITKGKYAGREQHIRIGQHNKFVRRVFSRGSWECHGRFYGGFWQQVSEGLRKDIFINGEPTIEIDFKALHVSLLYAIELHQVWPYSKDPFRLNQLASFAPDAITQRAWVKLLVLQSINAVDERKAFGAFRNESDTGSLAKGLKNHQLRELIDLFLQEHPQLTSFLFRDIGVRLMNHDSRLIAHIVRLATERGIPILTVHDSCICRRRDFAEVRAFMAMASIREVGYDLFVEQDDLEVDRSEGYDAPSLAEQIDALPEITVTDGFTARHTHWLERVTSQ